MTDETKQTKPKSRSKMVHARSIKSSGDSVLVEWFIDDIPHRGFIPISEFDFKKSIAPQSVLKAAIPFGVDWTRADVQIDKKRLDCELKRSGFWTIEDLKSNPRLVNIIIMRAAGLNRDALHKLVETEVTNE